MDILKIGAIRCFIEFNRRVLERPGMGPVWQCVEVVYEPFEEVMNLADDFLFYYTRTITSGQALSTNEPIIYINGGWEKWVPEVFESFSKRCFIVSVHFDERNRLIINEEELLDALARKPVEPDTEFIERYMLPDSLKA